MFEASGDDGDLAKEMGKERYKSLSEGDLDMVVIWRRSELLDNRVYISLENRRLHRGRDMVGLRKCYDGDKGRAGRLSTTDRYVGLGPEDAEHGRHLIEK